MVREAVQGVLGKLFGSPHILAVIDHDKVVAPVLVEGALQSICSALEVLLPLCLEEGHALARDDAWVLILQVSHGNAALLILGRVKFTGDRDLDGLCEGGSSLGSSHI